MEKEYILLPLIVVVVTVTFIAILATVILPLTGLNLALAENSCSDNEVNTCSNFCNDASLGGLNDCKNNNDVLECKCNEDVYFISPDYS